MPGERWDAAERLIRPCRGAVVRRGGPRSPSHPRANCRVGNPYGQRDRPRVNAWIEIERWHTWEAGGPMGVELKSG